VAGPHARGPPGGGGSSFGPDGSDFAACLALCAATGPQVEISYTATGPPGQLLTTLRNG
jgi:hypothetical protein